MSHFDVRRRLSGGYEIAVLSTEGHVCRFHVAPESGQATYFACGADWDYRKNGMTHAHYFGFERDLYVYDGKYLTKIGHKV